MNAKRFARPARAPAPRNPVARALAARGRSGAAGAHRRGSGAERRAGRMALQRSLRRPDGH